MKWLKRILISLVVIIACVFIGAYIWLNSSKPTYEGELKLSGLQDQVDVYFDDYGVPHIYAQNKHDLYMAFGYVHAQDRLFQMEMLRRAGSGRLAEIFGKPLLKVDRMFRSLGLSEYAQESAIYMESQKETPMYADITAYLEGINYFQDHGDTPPEFSIVGIEKKHYTIEDLYYITGAMSFSFSQAQKTEPVIDFISKEFGDDYLKDMGLWHGEKESCIRSTNYLNKKQNNNSSDTTATAESDPGISYNQKSEQGTLQLALAMKEIENILPFAPLEGSNSWVVSGKKTENGEVLFCNDTHIGYLLPQTWYEAHLNAPSFEMYGHFLGGIPFALVGRNRELSWGLTMLLNDDMDFYYETPNPQNADEYMYRGASQAYQIKEQTIRIKGEADTTIQVRYTVHGPIINDAFEDMNNAQPISMFWTYTKIANRTMDAFYGMNNAHTLDEFKSYLPDIHAPGLNINYGDKKGNVAWWACAKLVKRPWQVNSWTILDGASGKEDVTGYYDFSDNPRSVNPPWGYIYSANDWPQAMEFELNNVDDSVLSEEKAEIQKVWYPGYYKPQDRGDRIKQLLESNDKWTSTSIQEVMTDHYNKTDSMLMQDWFTALNENPKFSDSTYFDQYDELFRWDGKYDPMNPSPTFFQKMLYHYLKLAMADELGEKRFELFLQTHQLQRTQSALFYHAKSKWWDNIHTTNKETRDEILFTAFCKSIEELKEQHGDNPKVWNWRKAATMELKHPLGEVSLFRPFFNVGPEPVYGGNETILQAGFKLDSTGEYKVFFGSQMRIIVDFANVDSSLNMTPCGQSGHLMSKHYDDQAEQYREMKFRPQWMNKQVIETFDHLVLKKD
jgi:penicillin amidase